MKGKTPISKRSYLLIWFVLGLLLTAIDYYDHITRSSQVFENYKLKWLCYTLLSFATLFIATLFINICLKPFIKYQYIKEILSLLIGIVVFQSLGRWINLLTVPEIELYFTFKIIPTFVIVIIYTIVYILVCLLCKKSRQILKLFFTFKSQYPFFMQVLHDFFTQKLSTHSSNYIKHLRLERQLDFMQIYELSIYEYKELKVKDEMISGSKIAMGHSLCTAAMEYLNESDQVDDWFW